MSGLIMSDGKEYQFRTDTNYITCFRCGICCIKFRPEISDDEMVQIAEESSISIEQFSRTYVRTSSCIRRPVLDSGTGSCPFLSWEENGRAKCDIYSYRPQVCRDWQAGLMKLECQEGLLKLKDGNNIITPHDIYNSKVDICKLCNSLKMH